jgi:hypothetical protein
MYSLTSRIKLAKDVPCVQIHYREGNYVSLVNRKRGSKKNPRVIPHVIMQDGKWWCYFIHPERPIPVVVGRGKNAGEAYRDWRTQYVRIMRVNYPSWCMSYDT